jgi:signal transduction histidine kinase
VKIKTRITVFVVLSGLAASLLLSAWLICELLAQPFRYLDTSLREESAQAVRALSGESGKFPPDRVRPEVTPDIDIPPETWMEIRDAADGEILYRSQPAEAAELNSTNSETPETMAFEEQGTGMALLAFMFRYFRGAPDDRTVYRTRNFEIANDDRLFLVRIARPMDKMEILEKEILKILRTVAASLLFVTLTLTVIGRVAAGKILRPVKDIMALARNISDKNLAERVPIGKERDELTELAETLNRMLDRLQLSFARQKEFLFDTSHELKTPLTTIRLAVEEMNADGGLRLPGEVRGSMSRMESQVMRMERLVKDLLSLSALEALANVERNPVRVDVLLLSLIDEYRFWADAENIRMETEIQEGLVLHGDEEKLKRALSNVIDNAIKYNGSQTGEWLITVRAFESPKALTVIVSSTGEALSEEESRRVFDQFYRVEKPRSPRRGGSGLGLAIVKKTVELHRGEVRFESVTVGSRNMNRLILSFPHSYNK